MRAPHGSTMLCAMICGRFLVAAQQLPAQQLPAQQLLEGKAVVSYGARCPSLAPTSPK